MIVQKIHTSGDDIDIVQHKVEIHDRSCINEKKVLFEYRFILI